VSIDLRNIRTACDSLVAMGSRTRSGRPIFAKNSDRPAGECQPLVQAWAADHEPGTKLRCQYIEIDQVPHTHGFLGARPHWLWGLEHGLNECGVAIGNHTIFTKDPTSSIGLCGMDLVRLGLERAETAAEAVAVITTLIERHGQGGSGFEDVEWPYHNSFLCADRDEAWLLEASASHWVAKRARHGLSASNHTTIGADWDAIGHDTIEHARAAGWWDGPEGEPLDFAAAYRDVELIPGFISSGRYATTCAALDPSSVVLDVAAIQRVMRDHYDGGDVHRPGADPGDERYFSVCEHADPVGTTTASMVTDLGPADLPPLYYATLANPCIGPYLPLFVDAPLPAALTVGSREASEASGWWLFKKLLGAVEQDFEGRGPRVRDAWKPLEAELAEQARTLAEAGQGRRRDEAFRAEAGELMQRQWERVEAVATALIAELQG
jgi:secernin